MNESTFCTNPFRSLFLDTNGDIKFCCASSTTLGNTAVNKDLNKILHSNEANEIRKTILQGEWHQNCSYCKSTEEMSGTSQRIADSTAIKYIDYDSLTDEYYTLGHLDIRWNNLCNLACVYCDTNFSSKWASIKKEWHIKQSDVAEETVLDYVSKNIDNITSVNLLGGEPLLQKSNLKLLDLLENKNVIINVLTNLSVDLKSNKIAQKLLSIGNKVKWCVSFESIGSRFEYIRHGASWELFEKNLNIIYNTTGNQINIHPTYCVYSALSLFEFYDYAKSSNIFFKMHWQYLSLPKELDVINQSPEDISISISELDKCISKYPDDSDELKNIRKTLISSNPNTKSKIVSAYMTNLEIQLNKEIPYDMVFKDNK
jgi:hypothetical protein